MSDDAKPRAGFLGGKKPAVAPVESAPEAAPAQTPVPGAAPGFLRKTGPGAPPVLAAAAATSAPPAAIAQLPAAAPAGNRVAAEEHFQRGLEHYDRQELDQALAEYQQCVKADPSFAMGHNNLGMVLIDFERYEEALAELYETVRLDANYAEAYNNLGFALRRVQRQMEAASAYTKFLALEPGVEEGPKIQGWIDSLLREKKLTAVPPFNIPGATAPQKAEPAKIKKMAAWEVAAGNVETAAPVSATGEILDAAAPQQAAPAAFMPTVVATTSEVKAPVPAQAQPKPQAAPAAAARPAQPAPPQAAKPAQQKAPATPVALIEKGMDQFAEGNLDQASEFFNQAMKADPKCAEAHTDLAKVLIRQEKLTEGIELLRKATQLDPNDPAVYYVLGFALRAIEHNAEAAEAYEAFLNLMPDALDAQKMQEWVQHIKGSPAPAEPDEDLVADDTELVTALDHKYKETLGKFQEGSIDQVINDCVTILTEDPAHFRSRILLGRAYLRQKFFDNAMEQLEGALVTCPDYPEGLYFLGNAQEKKGDVDQTAASFKRYLEVLPEGPRAERLREWLTAHGFSESGGAKQTQCELCLRLFPADEVKQHDGKATCRNCLAVMGGEPVMAPSLMPEGLGAKSGASGEPGSDELFGAKKSSKGLVILGALGGMAAVLGVLFYLGTLNPLLERFGLRKRPPPINGDKKNLPPPVIPTTATWKYNKSDIKIMNEPSTTAAPFAQWIFTPKLAGTKDLDEHAAGWKLDVELKNGPPGMDPQKNALVWNPAPQQSEFQSLSKGELYQVDYVVKGTGKGPDGKEQELFSISKQFNVGYQFGYQLGPECDLGLANNESVAIATGDLNNDGKADTVICTGHFRHGDARIYMQRPNDPFPTPIKQASASSYSAAYVGDLDGNKTDDLIVADWQHGKLKTYYQDQELVAGPELEVGAGPVSIAVNDMENNGRRQVATLLSAGGALAISDLQQNRKFGEVVRIPLNGNGGRGFVLPWNSTEAGPGFLAVLPSAGNPLQFVPWNKGRWNKDGQGAIESGVESGLIAAAVRIKAEGGKSRLAVILNGVTWRLLVFDEKDGKFAPAGDSATLPGIGLGLLACDFNRDGQDDLFVVMEDSCGIYFANGPNLLVGPQYITPRMLGPIARLSTNNPPEIVVINEDRKAQIFSPVAFVPPAVAINANAALKPDKNASKVDPNKTYMVLLGKDAKKGDKYEIDAVADVNESRTIVTRGKPAQTEAKTRYELSAGAEVKVAISLGDPRKITFKIKKFTQTTNEKTVELIPADTLVLAERGENGMTFKVGNDSVQQAVERALRLVTDPVLSREESRAYEPTGKQKVGASWPANAGLLKQSAQKNLTGDFNIEGTVLFSGMKRVGDKDCLNIIINTNAKNFTPKIAPAGANLDNCALKTQISLSLPADQTSSSLLESAHAVLTLAGSPEGSPDTKLNTTTDISVERKLKYLPK